MLCAADKKLEELIIETLGEEPCLKADALRQRIATRARGFSIQAVYQELRKLERRGVVVRKRGLYTLRLLWLVELSNFANSSYASFLRSGALLNEVPEERGKKRWTFSNLRQLLDLWTELTFSLVAKVALEDRTLFEHVEHVWFHTANPVNEAQFVRAMKRERVKYVLVCRGRTYLDTTYRETVEKLGGRCSFGAGSFPGSAEAYLSLLGNYLIEVKLSTALAAKVRDFYRGTKRAEDLNPQALLQFAALRGRCSLELIFNPERARRERKKFETFLGR